MLLYGSKTIFDWQGRTVPKGNENMNYKNFRKVINNNIERAYFLGLSMQETDYENAFNIMFENEPKTYITASKEIAEQRKEVDVCVKDLFELKAEPNSLIFIPRPYNWSRDNKEKYLSLSGRIYELTKTLFSDGFSSLVYFDVDEDIEKFKLGEDVKSVADNLYKDFDAEVTEVNNKHIILEKL